MWVVLEFAGTPISETAQSDDPDHDGIVNLFEFAYRLDPTFPDNFHPIQFVKTSPSVPEKLTLRIREDEPSIASTFYRSTNLKDWEASPVFLSGEDWVLDSPNLTITNAENLGDGLWSLEIEDTGGDSAVFYQLGIETD